MASEMFYLHAIDPEWVRHNLIHRLDWSTSLEAPYLWEGYLWRPRIDPDLFQDLKVMLVMGLERLDILGTSGSNLIRLLAVVAFEFPDSLSEQERRWFLRKLNAGQLKEVVEIISDFLEGAGEQRAALWRERIGPWFLTLWPREANKKGAELSHSLALLAIKTGEAFQEAVGVVRMYIDRIPDIGSVLFALDESAHPDNCPDATIALLDGLLFYERPQQLWGYEKYLAKLSNRIRVTLPEATEDPRYRRIAELLERL